MHDRSRSRWNDLARDAVMAGWKRAHSNYGDLGVESTQLLDAVVERTLARFERAKRQPSDVEFRDAVERLAVEDLFLVLAWLGGDQGSWSFYARDHRDGVMAAARRQGASPSAAEEFADELPGSLMLAASGPGQSPLERYDGSGSLAGWLRVMARRRVADAARREARSEPLEPEVHMGKEPGPAAAARATELTESVRRTALELRETLTTRERLALLLKHEQGLSQRNIAARIGVSDSRVTRLMQHAVEKLRQRLEHAIDPTAPEEGTLIQELIQVLGSSESSGHVSGDPRDPGAREENP